MGHGIILLVTLLRPDKLHTRTYLTSNSMHRLIFLVFCNDYFIVREKDN